MILPRTIRAAGVALALATALLTPVVSSAAPAGAVTTACPAAEGNARFVRFIYLEILERCPDAGAASYWTAKLDAGLSRWSFAEAVDMSTENVVVHNVDDIYQGVLGRSPSTGERAAGVTEIRTNHQDGRLLAGIFASDEVYAGATGATTAAKDESWLDETYQRILDRPADSGGVAHFMAVFGPGGSTVASRTKVALSLENSSENGRSWITGVFYAGVGRGPDAAGTAYWLGWLNGKGQHRTFQLWTHVLSSNEGYARAQTQPTPS